MQGTTRFQGSHAQVGAPTIAGHGDLVVSIGKECSFANHVGVFIEALVNRLEAQ